MNIGLYLTEQRDAHKKHFLARAGVEHAQSTPIPGDASFRRYERLHLSGRDYILMDAPPPQENIRPFVSIAKFLQSAGFSAPQIFAEDETHGFLLLEDLGDAKFNTLAAQGGEQEVLLYTLALDVLLALRNVPVPSGLAPAYDQALLLREVMLLPEWYYPLVHHVPAPEALVTEYKEMWQALLTQISNRRECLVLRDYHADNLLLLPDRRDVQALGLLDFQDAVHGAAAYDLVSLLEDARRDVSPALQQSMLGYYIAQAGFSPAEAQQFRLDYALLGAQRNIKILGIFARLMQRDHKPHYASYLPRVWGYMKQDIAHPMLAPVRQWLAQHCPEYQP